MTSQPVTRCIKNFNSDYTQTQVALTICERNDQEQECHRRREDNRIHLHVQHHYDPQNKAQETRAPKWGMQFAEEKINIGNTRGGDDR
ncbi:uncharacterized protein N7479_000260 [Penicillium vulpinum]|uniref:uncharacterized protein n=1 Tax=Penicillium vulpinum TaxID=29845 RepID=UPI0025476AC7|nr:uncharacterized protein N7479_000260 [Penicillium vulpinum]KAJ5970342.1 hypothetical protein N7479_000260 [Penicillium vulpinum]